MIYIYIYIFLFSVFKFEIKNCRNGEFQCREAQVLH